MGPAIRSTTRTERISSQMRRISSSQIRMEVPPAPVARAGFQYLCKTDFVFVVTGFSFLRYEQTRYGAVINKKDHRLEGDGLALPSRQPVAF